MADSYKDFQREPSTPHQCVHESEKDGARCRGMAMANNYMCYAHRTDDVPTVIENDMFLIDDLSTHEAIQKAFCDVAGRLASNHIDLRRAELLITLLRAASRNLRDANTARRQAAAAGAPGSTASSSTLGSSPAGSFQNCQPERSSASAPNGVEGPAVVSHTAEASRAPASGYPEDLSSGLSSPLVKGVLTPGVQTTASTEIWLPLRTYTEEEQQFLQNTCWRKGYAPGNRPRPASITDEDIIAAINTGRFYCGNQKSIETEPNWNRATLSANSV